MNSTADMTNGRYVILENEQVPLAALQLPGDNAKPFTGIETASGPDFALPGYDTVAIPAETTGMVAPAVCIEHFTLSKTLSRGEH